MILYGQKVTPPENKCNKKYSFQLTGSRCDILLAAETAEWRTKWMNALGLAAIGYKVGYGSVVRMPGEKEGTLEHFLIFRQRLESEVFDENGSKKF